MCSTVVAGGPWRCLVVGGYYKAKGGGIGVALGAMVLGVCMDFVVKVMGECWF